MKKTYASVALLGATALVLAGCAGGTTPSTDQTEGSGEGATLRVWLVGTDTPEDARTYLTETFAEKNPGSELVIEEQQWTGLVDKLTTSLSSNDSPDIVEMGNTQAPAFTSSGALLSLTDIEEQLGGSDLLPGFVEAGTWDDTLYAAPYYSGSRVVFYNTAMYETAGVTVPTSLDVLGTGDGGFLMGIAELETFVRMRIPLVVVVYNDAAYGAEVHHFAPEGESSSVDISTVVFPDTDIAAIGRGFGAEGVTVRRVEDLEAVRRWLESDPQIPLVIDAKIASDGGSWWLQEAFAGH